jgi:two-component system, chemotaxis family, chemotaxis protein CheY
VDDSVKENNMLEAMEGLLGLLVEREEEIARLSQTIEILRKQNSQLMSRPHPQTQPQTQAQPSGKLGPATAGLLIVDPSEQMRSRLVNLLSSRGYRILGEAENGVKAVQVFKDKHPAIVTMEIEMPLMDGFEAASQIRAIDANAKIIMISRVIDRKMILRALDAGAVEFLMKPVPIDRLFQLLERLIGKLKTDQIVSKYK